jgi:hypothetical protein
MIVPVSSLCSGHIAKKSEQKNQKLKFNQNPEFYAKESYVGYEKLSKDTKLKPYISVLGSIGLMVGFLILLGIGKKAI